MQEFRIRIYNAAKYIDPIGEDAIIITNSNSVDVKATTLGHTSAIYQDANGEWYYTYGGNKATAVIHISSEYMGTYNYYGSTQAAKHKKYDVSIC